jgi:riboflavin synthase
MFTGLIQKTGRLDSIEMQGEAGRLALRTDEPWEPLLTAGESVAVQGVCLSLVRASGVELSFDVLAETFRQTNLSRKRPGDRLNLERALRAGDALGGHIVTGHVDGTGIARRVSRRGRDRILEVECPAKLARLMARKGSVACDGVSLTIVDLADDRFTVHVIPHTWSVTSLSTLRAGDAVNIETDLLAKHVSRLMEESRGRGLTFEKLREAGFAE